jgi:hypothetical protein
MLGSRVLCDVRRMREMISPGIDRERVCPREYREVLSGESTSLASQLMLDRQRHPAPAQKTHSGWVQAD